MITVSLNLIKNAPRGNAARRILCTYLFAAAETEVGTAVSALAAAKEND